MLLETDHLKSEIGVFMPTMFYFFADVFSKLPGTSFFRKQHLQIRNVNEPNFFN